MNATPSKVRLAPIKLRDRKISRRQAPNLRSRLKTFSADWDRAEMVAYDLFTHRR